MIIPGDAFRYLDTNQLTTVPSDLFENTTYLNSLYESLVRFCPLYETVPCRYFSYNPLQNLPSNIFQGTTRLEYM